MRILIAALSLSLCFVSGARGQTASPQDLRKLSNEELVEEAKAARASTGPSYTSTRASLPIKAVDRRTLLRVMAERGIYQPFAAVFTAAQSFGDAGNGAVPAAQTTVQTETLGRIAWESEHYGSGPDQKYHPDFSFGGNIGFTPALVLVNLTNQGTAVPPGARPTLQNAFEWDISPRLNVPIFSKGEVSAIATLGQTLLTSDVTSFKQGDNTTLVATRVSNSVGRAAIFGEYGAQFRMFSQSDLFQTHSEKSYLTPAFTISAGLRQDTRFRKDGDLAAYNNPERRYFFRFFISLSNIIRQKQVGDTSDPITLNFSVDYDKPVSDARVPAATRYTVSSNIDIMKLFHPSAQ
jgi:hypothetical protein